MVDGGEAGEPRVVTRFGSADAGGSQETSPASAGEPHVAICPPEVSPLLEGPDTHARWVDPH